MLSPNKIPATERPTLPADIILQVIFYCNVPTLRSLRATTRAIYDLVDRYENLICSVLRKSNYSNDTLRCFSKLESQPPSQLRPITCLLQLESRLATSKWLAGVVLECFNQEGNYRIGCVGPTEPEGDEPRDLIAKGWGIFWQLSDIVQDLATVMEYQEHTHKAQDKQTAKLINKTIRLIQAQCQNFIQDLQPRDKTCYCIHSELLSSAFSNRIFGNSKTTIFTRKTGDHFAKGPLWLKWLVLLDGPFFFVRAWKDIEENKICLDHITEEWSRRSKWQLRLETQVSFELSSIFWEDEEDEEFRNLLTGRMESDLPAGRSVLGSLEVIPFHIGYKLCAEDFEYAYGNAVRSSDESEEGG